MLMEIIMSNLCKDRLYYITKIMYGVKVVNIKILKGVLKKIKTKEVHTIIVYNISFFYMIYIFIPINLLIGYFILGYFNPIHSCIWSI